MSRTPKAYTAGFTIIEVIIVLAIASLILSLVFAVIPTLMRNSRNNQRKQDVSNILTLLSRYELNHSGNMPDACSGNCDTAFLQNFEPAIYDLSNITVQPVTTLDASDSSTGYQDLYINNLTPSSVLPTELIRIYNYHRCSTDSSGNRVATTKAAGYFDTVAIFAREGAGGSVFECQQL